MLNNFVSNSNKIWLANKIDKIGMSKNLIQRLNDGPVLCAEGYLFAMERRGYLQAGAFVPEVVLEHPEVVSQLHREFIRAGSDVVQAFTYYGHREKLRIIGKENLLEPLQKNALKIAKEARSEFKDRFISLWRCSKYKYLRSKWQKN